jgi:DNA-binding LacI/PurR family transcriptional regulator/AraC-like DNA-binding protein
MMEYITTDKILTLNRPASGDAVSRNHTAGIAPLPGKSGVVRTIAVCMDSFYDSYETEVLSGIEKYARTYGLRLIYFAGGAINSPHCDKSKKNAVFNLISQVNVDGIILLSSSLGSYCSKNEITHFFRRYEDIPIVSIGVRLEDIPSLTIDNYGGMCRLLVHLIEVHKCRRLAFISGPEKNVEARERFQAYKDILTGYNIPWDGNWVYPGTFFGCSAKEAVAELIEHWGLYFDAIVAANDLMAIQAIQELNQRGIDVPEDVIVTGFDNLPNATCAANLLTTVNQSAFHMGYAAAESIYGLCLGRACKDHVNLPTELVLRSSCGCVSPVEEHDNPGRLLKQFEAGVAINYNQKSLLSKNNKRGFVFSILCKTLGAVKDIEGLKNVLLEAFPKLKIKSCYISLFSINQKSRNILFYKDYRIKKMQKADETFRTHNLVPGGISNLCGENSFIIMTLSIKNKAAGFVLYESENSENELLEILSLQLSSALERLVHDEEPDIMGEKCDSASPDSHTQNNKYLKCGLPDRKAKQYYKRLLDFIDNEEIYKNPDLTLPDLAAELYISRNHLSRIINVFAGVNFYDFINMYRITEAKRILSDPGAAHINILNIAFEAGFKSKSTFNKIFKKFTAATPKEFRRENTGKLASIIAV